MYIGWSATARRADREREDKRDQEDDRGEGEEE